jgi:hypothetical protein
MEDHNKPRHIRDIAHLYLSRLPARSQRQHIWLIAESRECFGAYHAANLALGLARKGTAVEMVEVSGVLPCTAFFLRLPPQVYIKHKAQYPQEPLSALGGVKVRFALEEPAGPKNGVELVHLPPDSDRETLQFCLGRLRENETGQRAQAIVFATDGWRALDVGQRLFGAEPAMRWSTLSLERTSPTAGGLETAGRSLGYLMGWRQLLSDPVPCVVRDPESHLATSYLSICDALVSSGNKTKAKNERYPSRRSATFGRSG